MKKVGLLFSSAICTLLFYLLQTDVNAHNFIQNQDSVLFALIKQFEVEYGLASDNANINTSGKLNHSENAAELFNQINFLTNNATDKTSIVNRYETMLGILNSTTKALIAANIADESLRNYGLSKGLDPQLSANLLNMTMVMGNSMNMNIKNNTFIGNESTNSALLLSNEDIVQQDNFESSKLLAKSLKSIFVNYLKNATVQKSIGLMQIPMEMKAQSVKDLEHGIDNLILALDRKATLEEVYSIVHGQIHPNLFLAYDLKLKAE